MDRTVRNTVRDSKGHLDMTARNAVRNSKDYLHRTVRNTASGQQGTVGQDSKEHGAGTAREH